MNNAELLGELRKKLRIANARIHQSGGGASPCLDTLRDAVQQIVDVLEVLVAALPDSAPPPLPERPVSPSPAPKLDPNRQWEADIDLCPICGQDIHGPNVACPNAPKVDVDNGGCSYVEGVAETLPEATEAALTSMRNWYVQYPTGLPGDQLQLLARYIQRTLNIAIDAALENAAKVAETIPENSLNSELNGIGFGSTQDGYRRGRKRAATSIRALISKGRTVNPDGTGRRAGT